ncbi:MAG: hypothetical protein AAF242_17970 [Bacteroidota bacterium]
MTRALTRAAKGSGGSPQSAAGTVFDKYLEKQATYLEEIEESFAPIPILRVGHQGQEVFGTALLEKIGDSIYKDHQPSAVLHLDHPFEIIDKKNGFEIKARLPFLEKDAYTLKKFGDELVINIGNRRRTIYLPRFANYLKLKSHRYDAPNLKVVLEREE